MSKKIEAVEAKKLKSSEENFSQKKDKIEKKQMKKFTGLKVPMSKYEFDENNGAIY